MVLSSPKRKENSRLMNLSRNMNVAFPFNCDRHKSETERKFCSQGKNSRKIIDRGKHYYQTNKGKQRTTQPRDERRLKIELSWFNKMTGKSMIGPGSHKNAFFSVFLMPSRQIRVFRMCSLSRKRGIVPKQKFQSRG